MAYTKNFKDRRQHSSETVHLGTMQHPCGDMLVIKIDHADIPYPGAPVFYESKQIGRVDEIFGRLDEPYAAIKPEAKDITLDPGQRVSVPKDKFIARHRFMSREQVEKRKTERGSKPANNKGRNVRDNRRHNTYESRGYRSKGQSAQPPNKRKNYYDKERAPSKFNQKKVFKD